VIGSQSSLYKKHPLLLYYCRIYVLTSYCYCTVFEKALLLYVYVYKEEERKNEKRFTKIECKKLSIWYVPCSQMTGLLRWSTTETKIDYVRQGAVSSS
jgi:hypothetical protein